MSATCQRSPGYCHLNDGHPGFCFGKQHWVLGQDGKALRLCTDRACSFYLRHVENCPRCFGWGTAKEREGAGHQFERFPPLPASELADALASGDWLRCPECGGTPNGIAEEEASA